MPPTISQLASDIRLLGERVMRLEEEMRTYQNTLKEIHARLHAIETSIATARTFLIVIGGVVGPVATIIATVIQHYWH